MVEMVLCAFKTITFTLIDDETFAKLRDVALARFNEALNFSEQIEPATIYFDLASTIE